MTTLVLPSSVRAPCLQCKGSMEGKRPHAVYCSRACKTKASDARRLADGRSLVRDRARYASEAPRRRAEALLYLKEKPVKSKEFRLRRRARLNNAEVFKITERDWRRLLNRFRFACAYCGRSGVKLQRDHVTPLARGGRHSIGNILPVCPRCNYGKKHGFLIRWKQRLRNEVIA